LPHLQRPARRRPLGRRRAAFRRGHAKRPLTSTHVGARGRSPIIAGYARGGLTW
jgi:hypothetical protein